MMAHGHRLRLGHVVLVAVAMGGIIVPSTVRAAEPDAKARCKASYESAQVLQREERLEAARAQLHICRETCPAPLVRQCTTWEAEVEALLPTVRVAARDATGAVVRDVRILIDGRVITNVDGPVAVDPGAHVFRFEPRGGPAVETREDVHAGERERVVTVVVEEAPSPARPAPAAPPPPPPRSTTPSWVLGGVGVAALAVAGGLAIKGHVDRSDLRGSCAPLCDEHQVDAIRSLWMTSAAVGAVGAFAVVTAVLLWPRASGRPSATPSVAVSTGSLTLRWRLP